MNHAAGTAGAIYHLGGSAHGDTMAVQDSTFIANTAGATAASLPLPCSTVGDGFPVRVQMNALHTGESKEKVISTVFI